MLTLALETSTATFAAAQCLDHALGVSHRSLRTAGTAP